MRDGLNPVRLLMPQVAPDLVGEISTGPETVAGRWATVLDYLVARFPTDQTRLREKVAGGEVVDELGRPVTAESPYVPGGLIYLYRDVLPETRVPFEINVLHHDDDLLVVDKPHFLATTPRGAYVVESVVVRLRKDLGLPELSPAHRLDRITAGVLVLTTRREVRGAYQQLFATRTIRKTYEAVARVDPELVFPQVVRSHIVKERGTLWSTQVPGAEPNAESRIDLAAVREAPAGAVIGQYILQPHTGKTHQLRVHMAALGLPILGDNSYPQFYDVPPDDFTNPLQLLARSITFRDPFSGELRTFDSRRSLASWPPS